MDCIAPVRKPVAVVMILIFANLVLCLGPSSAAMIPTSDMLTKESADLDRQQLLSMMERREVQEKLQAWGVDPDMAKARIMALTDRELSRVAENMEGLPAGGNALGTIVGAALFIFIVLLITDILGLTDVFSFVKS